MKQTAHLKRDILNNPRIYEYITLALHSGFKECIRTSRKHNAIYGMADFVRCMVKAIASNAPLAAVSSRGMPSPQWLRNAMMGNNVDSVCRTFSQLAITQVNFLIGMGRLQKDMTVAIDKHLIPRYDSKPDENLVRSREDRGTKTFETYMTGQCVDPGQRLALCILPVRAFDQTSKSVRKMTDLFAVLPVKTVLMDREFFSVDVIRRMNQCELDWMIPCRRTDYVVNALEEYVAGSRPNVSSAVISSNGTEEPYVMLITEKRNYRRDGDASDRYIAFATNNPEMDTETYRKKWGIETGYRMNEAARPRTRTKDPVVRLLCFTYALAAFNCWVLANTILAHESGMASNAITVTLSRFLEGLVTLHQFEEWPPPIPP